MRIATLSHRELEAGYFSVELSQLKGNGFFFSTCHQADWACGPYLTLLSTLGVCFGQYHIGCFYFL